LEKRPTSMLLEFRAAIEIRPIVWCEIGSSRAWNRPTVSSQVDVSVSRESIDLFRLETSVTEHADLLLDVRPVSGGVVLVLQEVVEGFSHGDDSVGHALDFDLPVLVKFRRVEDLGGKTCAASGQRSESFRNKRDQTYWTGGFEYIGRIRILS
jgi:hypothetical protein